MGVSAKIGSLPSVITMPEPLLKRRGDLEAFLAKVSGGRRVVDAAHGPLILFQNLFKKSFGRTEKGIIFASA